MSRHGLPVGLAWRPADEHLGCDVCGRLPGDGAAVEFRLLGFPCRIDLCRRHANRRGLVQALRGAALAEFVFGPSKEGCEDALELARRALAVELGAP